MTIFVGSRYETGTQAFVSDAAGTSRLTLFRADGLPVPRTRVTYTVVDGDTIDVVAHRVYGRTDLWYAIADANPDILQFDPLPLGVTLRIPSAPDRL